jgi:hypothetical protein
MHILVFETLTHTQEHSCLNFDPDNLGIQFLSNHSLLVHLKKKCYTCLESEIRFWISVKSIDFNPATVLQCLYQARVFGCDN